MRLRKLFQIWTFLKFEDFSFLPFYLQTSTNLPDACPKHERTSPGPSSHASVPRPRCGLEAKVPRFQRHCRRRSTTFWRCIVPRRPRTAAPAIAIVTGWAQSRAARAHLRVTRKVQDSRQGKVHSHSKEVKKKMAYFDAVTFRRARAARSVQHDGEPLRVIFLLQIVLFLLAASVC